MKGNVMHFSVSNQDTKGKLLASLSNLPSGSTKNIGDYIQILAALQYARPDFYVDREALSDYDGPAAKIVLNGWFMHNPEKFPPSEKLEPLFISYHIAHLHEKEMLAPRNISYLKRYEPIGCRDRHTKQLLEEKGVKAYYSGCLTLTLGKNFHYAGGERLLIVDPYLPWRWMTLREMIKIKGLCQYALRHFVTVLIFACSQKLRLYALNLTKHRWFCIPFFYFIFNAAFLREYGKIVSLHDILNADFITNIAVVNRDGDVNESLLNEAKRYIARYAGAKAVITSRIHCALPCVAIGAPVTFIKGDTSKDNGFIWNLDAGRLDGPTDFFPTVSFENGRLIPESMRHAVADWRDYAERLSKCVDKFLNHSHTA